jgi:hypothetical protein
MKSLSPTFRYTILLTLGIGIFLVIVGLGPTALPFPHDSAFSDAVISHWPNALFFQESIRSGNFPLWRPLLMSGQPFAANPLNKVWYPPQWLVIFFPVTLHLNLLIWAHLVLAGLGMRSLACRLGFDPRVADVLGIAYALTPRLIGALGAGHLDIVYAMAWFPWLLWAVHLTLLSTRPTGQRIALFAAICALCFLADMRLSVFIFATGAVFAIKILLTTRGKWRSLIFLAMGGLLAIGLTAVQWLPLLTLAPYLSRGDLTPQSAAVFSLQPAQILGLLIPDQGGSHETLTYAGIVILILALIGLVRTFRQNSFWALVALFAALYALGDQGPLWPVLVRLLPPLLWLRVPSRLWIVVVMALIILAGYGIQALLEPRVRWISLAGMGLIGMGLAWGVMVQRLPLSPRILLSVLVGLLASGLLILLRHRVASQLLIATFCVLILFDVLWTDSTLVEGRPESTWLGEYSSLGQTLHDAGVTRLYSPDYSLPQQVDAAWNIQLFGGVDPFQSKLYIREFEAATGTHVEGYSVTLPPFNGADLRESNREAVIDADLLGRWNVSHVLASFAIDNPGLKLATRIGDLYLYENLRRPQGISITWAGSNRFSASNNSDQAVNIATWAPGWSPAPNETALTVDPGQTQTFDYQPPGLVLSLISSSASLVLLVIAAKVWRNA